MTIPALTRYMMVELLTTLTTSLLTIWPRRSSGATVRDKDPGERKHRAVINGGPHRDGPCSREARSRCTQRTSSSWRSRRIYPANWHLTTSILTRLLGRRRWASEHS